MTCTLAVWACELIIGSSRRDRLHTHIHTQGHIFFLTTGITASASKFNIHDSCGEDFEGKRNLLSSRSFYFCRLAQRTDRELRHMVHQQSPGALH